MWDLPGPGIEPMSFALAGKFFTTEPFLISLIEFQGVHEPLEVVSNSGG